MKKTLGLLVSGFVLFSFNGCGDSKIKELGVEKLTDGYALTIEEDEVGPVMMSERSTTTTSVYKFCPNDHFPTGSIVPLATADYSGDYFKYIGDEFVEYGDFDVYGDQIMFFGTYVNIMGGGDSDTIYTLDTEDGSFNVGSSYEVQVDHGGGHIVNTTIKKIEEIQCTQFI